MTKIMKFIGAIGIAALAITAMCISPFIFKIIEKNNKETLKEAYLTEVGIPTAIYKVNNRLNINYYNQENKSALPTDPYEIIHGLVSENRITPNNADIILKQLGKGNIIWDPTEYLFMTPKQKEEYQNEKIKQEIWLSQNPLPKNQIPQCNNLTTKNAKNNQPKPHMEPHAEFISKINDILKNAEEEAKAKGKSLPLTNPSKLVYVLVNKGRITPTHADCLLKNLNEEKITWNPTIQQFVNPKEQEQENQKNNEQKTWLAKNRHLLEIEDTQ
jgi:hypothetical protein